MVIIHMIYKHFINQKLFRTLVRSAGEGDPNCKQPLAHPRLKQRSLCDDRPHRRITAAVFRCRTEVGEGGEVRFGAVAFVRGEAVAGVARF